jgi:UDP-glucose 4-epimerase
MAILITGGTGFIGLHTAHAFLQAGEDVVATQFRVRRDPSFVRDALGGRLQREIVDISSPYGFQDVLRKHRVSGIMHLAVPGVGALSPSEDFRSIMVGLLNVLEAARLFDVKRVVVASSLAVYSGVPGDVHAETALLPIGSPTPTSAYKKAEEILGLHYADRTGLDVVFARIGAIYGPLYHSMVNPPSRMAHRAVRNDPAIAVDGISADERHDYCYVKDCADALARLQTAPELRDRIYNVGSGVATRHAEIADAVKAVIPSVTFTLGTGRPAVMRASEGALDLTAITRDTGFVPKYDIRAAMADYIAWLVDNDV